MWMLILTALVHGQPSGVETTTTTTTTLEQSFDDIEAAVEERRAELDDLADAADYLLALVEASVRDSEPSPLAPLDAVASESDDTGSNVLEL